MNDPVRLACVRHAASVRPEPGSNSPSKSRPRGEPRDVESVCFRDRSRFCGIGEPVSERQARSPTGTGILRIAIAFAIVRCAHYLCVTARYGRVHKAPDDAVQSALAFSSSIPFSRSALPGPHRSGCPGAAARPGRIECDVAKRAAQSTECTGWCQATRCLPMAWGRSRRTMRGSAGGYPLVRTSVLCWPTGAGSMNVHSGRGSTNPSSERISARVPRSVVVQPTTIR